MGRGGAGGGWARATHRCWDTERLTITLYPFLFISPHTQLHSSPALCSLPELFFKDSESSILFKTAPVVLLTCFLKKLHGDGP